MLPAAFNFGVTPVEAKEPQLTSHAANMKIGNDKAFLIKIISQCLWEYEYYTRLPKQVSQNGCVGTTKVEKNRLYYFDGWNALSIVFADTIIEPYKVVYLGDIEDMLPQMQAKGSRIHIVVEVDR